MLWAKAAEGTCDGLGASLVRLCSACLAAQPLAAAFYAHHCRRHLPAETVPPTRLLMELSAAYLVGSLATAGGGASVQGLLASLLPLAPDAPLPLPPTCATPSPDTCCATARAGGAGRRGGRCACSGPHFEGLEVFAAQREQLALLVPHTHAFSLGVGREPAPLAAAAAH